MATLKIQHSRKPLKRVCYEDRKQIEKMLNEGETIGRIAQEIDVSYVTIYREISRTGLPYSADKAQKTVGMNVQK